MPKTERTTDSLLKLAEGLEPLYPSDFGTGCGRCVVKPCRCCIQAERSATFHNAALAAVRDGRFDLAAMHAEEWAVWDDLASVAIRWKGPIVGMRTVLRPVRVEAPWPHEFSRSSPRQTPGGAVPKPHRDRPQL